MYAGRFDDAVSEPLPEKPAMMGPWPEQFPFPAVVTINGLAGLERLGTPYGGWVVPVQLLHPGAVCVCAGAGEDVSFDVELAERFGCRVIVLDPTPRAIRHVRSLFEATRCGGSMAINHRKDQIYRLSEKGLRQMHFEEAGLWDRNETLRFYAPKNGEHVSHSALNLQGTDECFEARAFTL